jgi:hypothetical protein
MNLHSCATFGEQKSITKRRSRKVAEAESGHFRDRDRRSAVPTGVGFWVRTTVDWLTNAAPCPLGNSLACGARPGMSARGTLPECARMSAVPVGLGGATDED